MFGAAIPVLNEWRFFEAAAGQLLKVCDRVIALRSTRPFSGSSVRPPLSPIPKLDPRVEVVHLWSLEHEARNAGIEILGDVCDYIFTVDSDEIFTLDALRELRTTAEQGHRAVACLARTYWKTPRFEINPMDRFPVTVVVRKDMRFRHLRLLDKFEPHVIARPLMHHLSYVRTDDEVKEKLRTYGHAHQVWHEGWFEKVWKRWDGENELCGLHPVNPKSFGRAVPVVYPELEEILAEYSVQ